MPYAPMTEDRSGMILAAGMGQGLEALLQGAAKGDEMRKQRKRTETILGALYPDQKDSFAGMALGELEGLVDKAAYERTQRAEQREVERMKADAEQRKLDEAHRRVMEEMQRGQLDVSRKNQETNQATEERQARADAYERQVQETERYAMGAAMEQPKGMAEDFMRMGQPGRGVLRAGEMAPLTGTSRVERYGRAGGKDWRAMEQLAQMDRAGGMGGYRLGQTIPVEGGGDVIVTAQNSGQYRPSAEERAANRGSRNDPGKPERDRWNSVASLGRSVAAGMDEVFNGQILRRYWENTRGPDGSMKPGAQLNPLAERRLAQIQAMQDRIDAMVAGGEAAPGNEAVAGAPAPGAAQGAAGQAGMAGAMAVDEFTRRMKGGK